MYVLRSPLVMRVSRRIQRFLTSPRAATLLIIALIFTILRLSYNSTQTPSDLSPPKVPSRSSSEPRVAIVTFTTQELSYTHLSLKNKQGR
jgi:hypothetical protein